MEPGRHAASDQAPVAIRLEGLTKTFGARPVLSGLDLTLPRGQALAVVGANGAGKTTLLRLMAGLCRPTSGAVLIEGLDTRADAAQARRLVGFLSHHPLAYLGLSAEENLRFYAGLYGLSAPEARIAHLLERVGLGRYRHSLVRTYSRGIRQRLAIARLLLHEPPILLLDEPYTGLDEEGVRMLHMLLADGPSQPTLVLTAHVAEQAAAWGAQVRRLRRGRLVEEGEVA
jgi:heme exporter protein A